MNCNEATKYLRAELDSHNLNDWKIRLVTDLRHSFLGMCSYKDKSIILNAHHVDTHPEIEVIDTIKHEIAHALCPNHGHDEVWHAKALEIGCTNPRPCVNYSLDERAIDAIRSGAQLEITFEERIVREPKYKISRIQDKCPTCGKVAKEKSRSEVKTSKGRKVIILLECNHAIFKDAESSSPFDEIVFDGSDTCKHQWGIGRDRTRCLKCNAKRLFQYQIDGARALEKANGRLSILDEMGLGKTIQALAYLKFHEKDAWPFLWVTKSGVKFQHAKEIVRLLGKKAFPQILLTGKGKDFLIPGMNVLASYDIFRRLDLTKFKEHGFKTIVLDECQAIKNPDSSRTQAIRTIIRDIPKVIPLSGTFWKNRGSEAFVMLNILDPIKFWSFKGFKSQYIKYGPDGKEKGFYNPEKFRDEIAHVAIRRERAEVMPELPLISRNKILCEVPDYARKTYQQEQDNLVKNYNDFVIDGKEDSFEAHQVLMQSLIQMRQIIGLAKVPATVEFVKEFIEETDRKLVIFVHHIKCGELIYDQIKEFCQAEGHALPLQLTAQTDAQTRFHIQEQFNSPHYRILIASTLASGEGLNLQSCSDCVMHERQWNASNEMQAEGRFIRIGQQAETVTATYIHADDSIDTDLDEMVELKRKMFDESMNKAGYQPAWNEQSIIKDLAARIARKKKYARVS